MPPLKAKRAPPVLFIIGNLICKNSVVAIGNAPTALYELMNLWRDGAPLPAAIALFPLGFVGAAEAKQEFLNHYATVPFVTLTGRRGGSALAAAAINAAAHHS